MKHILRRALCRASHQRITILREFSGREGKVQDFAEVAQGSLENTQRGSRNATKGYVDIIIKRQSAGSSTGSEESRKKGYVEITRKDWRKRPERRLKTLTDMRDDVDNLTKELYKLRSNEKGRQANVPNETPEEEQEELRLAPYVSGPVETVSLRVRTPDRRILLKHFTGINSSRAILEMMRERKVRINEIVIYDFAIICKPMDTIDVWKGELEENPAFARVDRFQITRIVLSPCCQYYTIRAIALKEFLIENWLPYKIPEDSLSNR